MAFPSNCLPRIVAVDDSCGCTLTRASITGMTPQAFENLGATEIEMHRVISRSVEAKIAGVRENFLEDLLMSKISNIKGALGTQKVSNQSVILPYIYRRQKRNINANYWNITAGAATSGAGSGSIPASAWDFTVTVSSSSIASPLTALERYFLPGKYIVVLRKDSVTGVARTLHYKILTSVNADAGGVYKAKISVQPNLSTAGWAALSSDDKAVYQPTDGTLIVLANSVSDYESWCNNHASENTQKLLTYWLQTSRDTHCFNDEYMKALNAALTSGYWKDFATLPLAEQKKQQAMNNRREWINSIFYNGRLNELQQVETYTQLDQVVDPANTDCVLEYKANALGFREQLSDCSRVVDNQGAQLDLDVIAATGYDLKRAREASGGEIDTIDCMTDRFTAGRILDIMTAYYQDKYGAQITRFYQPDQALKHGDQVALKYNTYQLPPELGGYNLAVFTHPFFDDQLSAFQTANADRGRQLWMLDWSDLEIGIAGSSSVARQTNVADNLYNCVIRPNVNHYQLNSTTWTAILEDPSRHAMIENFSDECPNLTLNRCTPYEA